MASVLGVPLLVFLLGLLAYFVERVFPSARVHFGGFKGGTSYGASDEWSYRAATDPIYCYDLHATILHLMGIDHTRLTYRYQGRDFRLTDVNGHVVKDLLL